jgi:hypothetical protein
MRVTAALASILLASTIAPGLAAAAPPLAPRRAAWRPPVALAVLAGAATALIPLAIGSSLAAAGSTDGAKNVGLGIAGAGVALSPIVGHGVLGEWRRAMAFGVAPIISEIGIYGLLKARPDAVYHGTKVTRTTFGAMFSVDLFSAALGLVDVMMAGERRGDRGGLGS